MYATRKLRTVLHKLPEFPKTRRPEQRCEKSNRTIQFEYVVGALAGGSPPSEIPHFPNGPLRDCARLKESNHL